MIIFTDEDIEIIKEVFSDWGSDMPCADYDKVRAVGVKLGVWEEEKPPTEEELKRREEFAKSPVGLKISELLNQSNDYYTKLDVEYVEFYSGEVWKDDSKISTQLRIRLPNDFKT